MKFLKHLEKYLHFDPNRVFGKQPFRKDTSEQGVPFVATYHPKLTDLGKLIKNL